MTNLRSKAVSYALAFAVCSLTSSSQTPETNELAGVPDLVLQIVPEKRSYRLNERGFARVEMRNQSKKTLCFSRPSQECRDSWPGSVLVTANPVFATENEMFICARCGGGTYPLEKLIAEIKTRWIWLAPNETYIMPAAPILADLRVMGRWELRAAYSPPEGSFNVAAVTKYLAKAAEAAGCSIPTGTFNAKPVFMEVLAAAPPDNPRPKPAP